MSERIVEVEVLVVQKVIVTYNPIMERLGDKLKLVVAGDYVIRSTRGDKK